MALDASEMLGVPQQAGVKVNPRGMGMRAATLYGGYSGGAIGPAINARRHPNTSGRSAAGSDTPTFGRLAYLAVTADEVVLIEVKSRIFTTYLANVLACVPRAEVRDLVLDKGGLYSMPLTVNFTGGERWALEVPKPYMRDARRVAEAFAA